MTAAPGPGAASHGGAGATTSTTGSLRPAAFAANGRPRPAHAGPPASEERHLGLGGYRPARPVTLRLRLRPRTVRARIVSLLMVPVVSLLALWAFATVTTAQSVDSLIRLKQVDQTLLSPVGATVDAVQAERAAALAYLAAPVPSRMDAFDARARATDAAVGVMDQDILRGESTATGLSTTLAGRIDALNTATAGLRQLRARVEGRQLDWTAAADGYAGLVDSAFGVVGSLTGVQNSGIASDARVVLELSQAREMLAREDAAVQSAQAAGRMSPEQYQEFTGALYSQRATARSAAPDLRPADLAAYRQVSGGPQAQALTRMEDAIRTGGGGTRSAQAAGGDWAPTAAGVQQQLDAVLTGAGAAAGANADPYSVAVLTRNGAAVLFGLAAVCVSLLISVRIGRGLVVELVGLRNSALELAGRRLPAAMRRLRAGEEIDIEAEAPVVQAGEDEIGQVGEALNSVQRAALTAAVERAEVLSGVSGVFVNLARRSQVLVHRQLTLLDAMERRTEDPGELEDLFRLDHLTTRMRRHAEGLIILSGAAPGRAWRRPVPLLDVVRSAVAEVEDYSRVDVRRLPGVAVVGAAVADLTHLIAELVENATAFSPPHTKVVVTGEQVGAGYAVEIEDRGLGMGKEAVAEANRRIADAQQADLFDSDRLGLFVVSRLARRHGVRVSLRPSAYGGTTAVVLLPTALLETGRTRQRAPIDAELDLPPLAPPEPATVMAGVGAGGTADGAERPLPPLVADPAADRPTGRAGVSVGSLDDEPLDDGPAHDPHLEDRRLEVRHPVDRRTGDGEPDEHPGVGRRAATDRAGATPLRRNTEELPRRVRQANLAVQLRDAPPVERTRPSRDGGAQERSPEEARATMSALRDGWARGRGGHGGPAGQGTARHLKIHQERQQDVEDFERKAADGRDDEPHR
ncbi:sensor histidine kinase [Streptacidiphilus rugosus]|uniref:sensor histidine kinase n=1 Tax=Streptacidiphilus rugosus TaxID=405783 RepID=UPI0007C74A21|nr:nitrate- and nitrite sensing domain-containing protein [Streptacidiphilus rugosus]